MLRVQPVLLNMRAPCRDHRCIGCRRQQRQEARNVATETSDRVWPSSTGPPRFGVQAAKAIGLKILRRFGLRRRSDRMRWRKRDTISQSRSASRSRSALADDHTGSRRTWKHPDERLKAAPHEIGSTGGTRERHGLFRHGALLAAQRRPSTPARCRECPPNIATTTVRRARGSALPDIAAQISPAVFVLPHMAGLPSRRPRCQRCSNNVQLSVCEGVLALTVSLAADRRGMTGRRMARLDLSEGSRRPFAREATHPARLLFFWRWGADGSRPIDEEIFQDVVAIRGGECMRADQAGHLAGGRPRQRRHMHDLVARLAFRAHEIGQAVFCHSRTKTPRAPTRYPQMGGAQMGFLAWVTGGRSSRGRETTTSGPARRSNLAQDLPRGPSVQFC